MMWLHEGHIEAIRNFPQLLFSAQWQLFDIAVSNRNEGYTECLDGKTTTTNDELRRLNNKGLVERDQANGIQMKDYINKTYLKEDEQIKDQTTLTQWTGKLLGSMFGKMDERHLQGNFSPKDFEKLKDYYWLCLSIINKIVQLDLRELRFAPYLYEEHEKTPSITDYKNSEGQNIMDRLSILKSAMKGESLFS